MSATPYQPVSHKINIAGELIMGVPVAGDVRRRPTCVTGQPGALQPRD
jgi:hypothetical protein